MNVGSVPRAGRREWIGLAVLALPCLLVSMDLTVLNLAVPMITADLQPSSSQLLWIVDIYGFLIAGSLITMGTLGDRIGRRRLLLMGGAAFGVASVLAAFSTSAEMLIATRALLGVAGATLMPSTLALIRNMFQDPRQRTIAISVWVTSFSVGGAIGPLLGGAMLEFFWWGSVFLLAAPVMVLLLVLGPKLLPEFRDPAAGRLDLPSAALSLVAVLAMIYGVKQIAEDGLGWTPVLWIVAGLAIGLVFFHRQRTLADPLIDVRLFRVLTFSTSLATNTLAIFVMMGAFFFIGQYLQLVRGLSPLEAGLVTLPSTAGIIAGSMLVPMIARRVRPAYLVGAGLLASAPGFALLTQVGLDSLSLVVAGTTIMALGLSPVFTLGTDLIIGSAPPERAGAASAISETGNELGAALGIAILGSVGTAVYRSEVTDAVPAGIPPESAAAARDTLGGAVEAAAQLPDALGAALLDAAHGAFIQGLQTTAAIGVAIMIGMAILATTLLRNVQAGSEAEAHAEEKQEEQRLAPSARPEAYVPASGG